MKVAAIVASVVVASAGLIFLWQTGREPADSAHGRGRPPAAARNAAPPTRDATPTRNAVAAATSEARQAPDASSGRSAPTTREPAAPVLGVPEPTSGERKLLGAVLSDTGPVLGAQVLVLERGVPVAEADTDKLGRFEIEFTIPIEQATLRILARGYAPLERALGSPRRPGEEHLGNLNILRGSVLSGTVVDDAGRAAGGVEVGLGLWSGDGNEPRILERTRTSANGVFRFANAPSGRVSLTTRAEGWAHQTTDHTHGVGEDAHLQLVRASTLRLHVQTPDGKPVADASAEIQPLDRRGTPREGKTDADGRLVFEGLDSPAWSVRITQPGYRPTGLSPAAANDKEHELELAPWPCIAGLVLTHDRKPAPRGTRVVALPGGTRGDSIQLGSGGTPVDAEGRFRICDLRPGSYLLRASAPGFAPTSSHDVQVGQSGDLDIGAIVLLEGGTLALHLTTGDGPASGVDVELHRTPPVPAQVWTRSAVPAGTVLQRSDAEGRVALEHLGAGDVWLILRSDSTVPISAGPFTLIEGRRNEPAALELEQGTRIQGRVLQANGTPQAHARIQITGPNVFPTLFADQNGSFDLPPLPAGSYSLQALSRTEGEALESAPHLLELAAGQGVVTVDLRFD